MVERIGDFAKLNFPAEWPPEKRADVRAQYQQAEGKAGRKKTKGKRKKAKEKTPSRGMRKAKHTEKRSPQKARKEPKARSR